MAARARLSPEERAEASRRATEQLTALPAFASARTVALYAPLGTEMDTGGIAHCALAGGKMVVFPRVVPGALQLAFAACHPEDLVPGPLRAREPPPGAPLVPPSSIDLVVVPGVAFDTAGRRLGRGGGCYDATLTELSAAARVGLAFEVQIVPTVPDEPHDVHMDMVVTESHIYGGTR